MGGGSSMAMVYMSDQRVLVFSCIDEDHAAASLPVSQPSIPATVELCVLV